eukprot:GHVR01069081.1.p1 GENE.GHVR01069081.1~~GHVR01069081.1.p1  ORF type:complete len:239 (+),score=46.35 GHVR01069081.1:63-779(+)
MVCENIKYNISKLAYVKMALHCLKYPKNVINGIFIGYINKLDDNNIDIIITDTVPLFHTNILSPMMKLSCVMIEEYCNKQCPKLNILSYYQYDNTCVHISNITKFESFRNCALKISNNSNLCNNINISSSSAFTLDLKSLEDSQHGIQGFIPTQKEGVWASIPSSAVTVSSGAYEAFKAASLATSQLYLYDFDDHLSNTSNDFFNTNLALPSMNEEKEASDNVKRRTTTTNKENCENN